MAREGRASPVPVDPAGIPTRRLPSRYRRSDSPSLPAVCPICESTPPQGWHFGAPSCSACCAFFRRLVTNRRRYRCLKDARLCRPSAFAICDERSRGLLTCKHCRAARCLQFGMRPEAVECRRETPTVRISEMGQSSTVSLSATSPLPADLPLLSNVLFAFRHIDMFREQLNECPSEVAGGPSESIFYSMAMHMRAVSRELQVMESFLDIVHDFAPLSRREKRLFTQNSFHLWAPFYCILRTVTSDCDSSAAARRFYTDRNSYIGLSEEDIRRFADSSAGVEAPVDKRDLARFLQDSLTCMHSALFHSLKALRLEPTEVAAVLLLSVLQCNASISSSNSDFSFRRLRNALVAELSQFYKRRGVHPTRLGEVILLLSTLSDTGAAFTQLAAYMHVTCGNSAYTRARLEAANHSELETGIVVKKELPD